MAICSQRSGKGGAGRSGIAKETQWTGLGAPGVAGMRKKAGGTPAGAKSQRWRTPFALRFFCEARVEIPMSLNDTPLKQLCMQLLRHQFEKYNISITIVIIINQFRHRRRTLTQFVLRSAFHAVSLSRHTPFSLAAQRLADQTSRSSFSLISDSSIIFRCCRFEQSTHFIGCVLKTSNLTLPQRRRPGKT